MSTAFNTLRQQSSSNIFYSDVGHTVHFYVLFYYFVLLCVCRCMPLNITDFFKDNLMQKHIHGIFYDYQIPIKFQCTNAIYC